jgi:hypothetical protein
MCWSLPVVAAEVLVLPIPNLAVAVVLVQFYQHPQCI